MNHTADSIQAGRRLAIFDFDGTMIKGDSILPHLLFALRRGAENPLRIPSLLLNTWRGLSGRISAEEGKSRALRFLASMDPGRREAFNLDFCRQVLLPRIYPKALERMEHHRRQGDGVLLVSASPDIYMRHMQELLPVDAVLASLTSPDGRVTRNCKGEEKVRRVQEWAAKQGTEFDWANSWAYGDSAHDLPVMRLTGNPVLVNPKPAAQQDGAGLPVEQWAP